VRLQSRTISLVNSVDLDVIIASSGSFPRVNSHLTGFIIECNTVLIVFRNFSLKELETILPTMVLVRAGALEGIQVNFLCILSNLILLIGRVEIPLYFVAFASCRDRLVILRFLLLFFFFIFIFRWVLDWVSFPLELQNELAILGIDLMIHESDLIIIE